MVKESKVSFDGPKPGAEDVAAAAMDTLKDSLKGGAIRREEAETALRDAATAAGVSAACTAHFFKRNPGGPATGTGGVQVRVGAGAGLGAVVTVEARAESLDERQLRQLCVDLVAGATTPCGGNDAMRGQEHADRGALGTG